jgi:hypothetical protein
MLETDLDKETPENLRDNMKENEQETILHTAVDYLLSELTAGFNPRMEKINLLSLD